MGSSYEDDTSFASILNRSATIRPGYWQALDGPSGTKTPTDSFTGVLTDHVGSLTSSNRDVPYRLVTEASNVLFGGLTSLAASPGPWENSTGTLDNVTYNSTAAPDAGAPHALWEIVLISIVVTIVCVLTAGGNLMVMISFKMDNQLQTVSNYFLLSLSVADFFIGIVSMPLYTVYLLMNRWPLGPFLCDTWLSLDYTMSNASVANLLIICFDRYYSVTRPLTYRAKRTPRRAAIMISCAWLISALMWTPWIFAWPYIEGRRKIAPGECYIQFLVSNHYITITTAIAAFYLPVFLMCVLYFKIYMATQKRQKDLQKLQATRRSDLYRKTDSSDDDVYVNLNQGRSDSSPDFEECDIFPEAMTHRHRPRTWWQKVRACCHIDRDSADYMEDSSSSDPPGSPGGYDTYPGSSKHGASHHYHQQPHHHQQHSSTHHRHHHALRKENSLPTHLQQNGKHQVARRNSPSSLMIPLITVPVDPNRSSPSATPITPSTQITTPSTQVTGTLSRHSNLSSVTEGQEMGECEPRGAKDKRDGDTYTILIKLPDSASEGPHAKPTIRMISEDSEDTDSTFGDKTGGEHIPMRITRMDSSDTAGELSGQENLPSVGRRLTQTTDALRLAMQARIAARLANKVKHQRARRKRQEKKQDQKAAKTLSAILLAFIVTWTPYNIFTVINPFCGECVNETLYAIGYWLCYINSTINPLCYALCNANFRRTYWRILTCRFARKKRPVIRRGPFDRSTYTTQTTR